VLTISFSVVAVKLYCLCYFSLAQLKDIAYQTGQTIYQIKYALLSDYLIQQLKRPNIFRRFV
jgi:hypothetical protein